MAPADARKVLADSQSAPVSKLPVDEEWITVPSQVGDVRVRIIKPQGTTDMLPVIAYMHGGGWILGNAATHDRLVRELAVGAGAALAFAGHCGGRSHGERHAPLRQCRSRRGLMTTRSASTASSHTCPSSPTSLPHR
ncbi:alpha/beta hydrolase fold domain-containing protein [Streptomyces xiangluensis]|uniref:Alpha/beta hydrolase fold domain-containing protein n=1 Tax=Streptomyces xiangluensis TaxID=2665720 RepID=A0ABV8YG06_9ACTN